MRRIVLFDIGGTLAHFNETGTMYTKLAGILGDSSDSVKTFIRQNITPYKISCKEAVSIIANHYCIGPEYYENLKSLLRTKSTFTLYDDVLDILVTLKNNNIETYCVSNAMFFRTYSMKELGLEDLLNRSIYSFDCGYVKPDIRFFQSVEKIIMLDEKDMLSIVGDSFTSDIEGPLSLGWNAILVNRNRRKEDYTKQIYTLEELPEILRL